MKTKPKYIQNISAMYGQLSMPHHHGQCKTSYFSVRVKNDLPNEANA